MLTVLISKKKKHVGRPTAAGHELRIGHVLPAVGRVPRVMQTPRTPQLSS